MLIAFGLEPLLRDWAESRCASTLMGLGAADFIAALNEALSNTANHYAWQMRGIDVGMTLGRAGWYSAGYLSECQYTNWELFAFYERPEIWPRTTWWHGDEPCENPLEQWP